jgi:hypothetical protein
MKASPKDFVIWLLGFVELGCADDNSYHLPTKSNWEKIVQRLKEMDTEDYTTGPTSDFIRWLRGYIEIGCSDELTNTQWRRVVEVLYNTIEYEPMIVNVFKKARQIRKTTTFTSGTVNNNNITLERSYEYEYPVDSYT